MSIYWKDILALHTCLISKCCNGCFSWNFNSEFFNGRHCNFCKYFKVNQTKFNLESQYKFQFTKYGSSYVIGSVLYFTELSIQYKVCVNCCDENIVQLTLVSLLLYHYVKIKSSNELLLVEFLLIWFPNTQFKPLSYWTISLLDGIRWFVNLHLTPMKHLIIFLKLIRL